MESPGYFLHTSIITSTLMNTEETININDLLSRPVWQLTCEEYCALMRHLLNESGSSATNNAASRQAIGMTALAKALGCSSSFLYGISHNIDMDSAVISRIGRKPVFDIEIARKLANDYMVRVREERNRGA